MTTSLDTPRRLDAMDPMGGHGHRPREVRAVPVVTLVGTALGLLVALALIIDGRQETHRRMELAETTIAEHGGFIISSGAQPAPEETDELYELSAFSAEDSWVEAPVAYDMSAAECTMMARNEINRHGGTQVCMPRGGAFMLMMAMQGMEP